MISLFQFNIKRLPDVDNLRQPSTMPFSSRRGGMNFQAINKAQRAGYTLVKEKEGEGHEKKMLVADFQLKNSVDSDSKCMPYRKNTELPYAEMNRRYKTLRCFIWPCY